MRCRSNSQGKYPILQRPVDQAQQKEIIPIHDLIANIMNEAENILKSMGFNSKEFSTIS